MKSLATHRAIIARSCLIIAIILAFGLFGQALARDSGIQIALSPASKTVTVGDVFVLDLVLHAGNQPLDGVQVYLDFAPAILQVVDVVPDLGAMNTILANPTWDNAAGKLSYASGILIGSAITGTCRIATLRFQAMSPTNAVTISFDVNASPLPVTKVAYLGESMIPIPVHGVICVLAGTPTATVTPVSEATVTSTPSATWTLTPTVQPTATPTATSTTVVPAGYGILQGRITLQGRAQPAGALISAGGYSVISASGGYFSLALPAGSHTVSISMNGYLRASCPAVAIIAGATIQGAEVMLLSGDADGDCDVDLFDLVAVAASFNQIPPAPPPYVDLNSDGQINILDVVMVASNYGKRCPSPWTCP